MTVNQIFHCRKITRVVSLRAFGRRPQFFQLVKAGSTLPNMGEDGVGVGGLWLSCNAE